VSRSRKRLILLLLVAGGFAVLWSQLPALGARLLLIPHRRPPIAPAPPGVESLAYQGDGVRLAGWRGTAEGPFRGTLIYLHGIADNRTSGAGVLDRFRRQGFDVVAYDSRAHGESEGEHCTYGYHEKQDLRRVLDTLRPAPKTGGGE